MTYPTLKRRSTWLLGSHHVHCHLFFLLADCTSAYRETHATAPPPLPPDSLEERLDMDISPQDIHKVNSMLNQIYGPCAEWLMARGIPFFYESTPVLVLTQYGQDEKVLRMPPGPFPDDETRLQLEEEQLQNEANQFAAPYRWSAVKQFGWAGAHVAR